MHDQGIHFRADDDQLGAVVEAELDRLAEQGFSWSEQTPPLVITPESQFSRGRDPTTGDEYWVRHARRPQLGCPSTRGDNGRGQVSSQRESRVSTTGGPDRRTARGGIPSVPSLKEREMARCRRNLDGWLRMVDSMGLERYLLDLGEFESCCYPRHPNSGSGGRGYGGVRGRRV